jgi:regulator of nucleoside diphosphate kinase
MTFNNKKKIMINTIIRTIYITKPEMIRLHGLIAATKATRDDLGNLRAELEHAHVVDPEQIPPNVITMNSQAKLRDLQEGEEMIYTLVFPENANCEQNRISVLAPIGTAMLGQREGDEFEWEVPAGSVRLKVVKVLYQPEASRHFHL